LLREEDPEVAGTLFPNDKQRIARALEVIRSTGKSLGYWQQHPHKSPLLSLVGTTDVPRFVLNPPRRLVYERCEDRLAQMIRQGALDEVAALPEGLPSDLPALKALGVPEIRAYLAGELELAEAQQLVATGTRQFAKRQMTWFRNQFSDWEFLWEQESEKMIELIVNKIT
ncbi:MAG: tRNA dimethylallyltransferase, partial [Alphaproteobacteria bacterium]|nr:tRNA dimethylallyltransferase [Alphaproteobacteria bacterium]